MPFITRLLTAGFALSVAGPLGLQVARAQAPQQRGLAESAPRLSTTRPEAPHVLFMIGPLGFAIDAPVQGPGNSNIGFRTYQGQAMTGKEAILENAARTGPAD